MKKTKTKKTRPRPRPRVGLESWPVVSRGRRTSSNGRPRPSTRGTTQYTRTTVMKSRSITKAGAIMVPRVGASLRRGCPRLWKRSGSFLSTARWRRTWQTLSQLGSCASRAATPLVAVSCGCHAIIGGRQTQKTLASSHLAPPDTQDCMRTHRHSKAGIIR